MPDSPRVAETITAILEGGNWTLEVDGEPFPWHVSDEPGVIAGPITTGGQPTLTVIPCDRLEIVHQPIIASS